MLTSALSLPSFPQPSSNWGREYYCNHISNGRSTGGFVHQGKTHIQKDLKPQLCSSDVVAKDVARSFCNGLLETKIFLACVVLADIFQIQVTHKQFHDRTKYGGPYLGFDRDGRGTKRKIHLWVVSISKVRCLNFFFLSYQKYSINIVLRPRLP